MIPRNESAIVHFSTQVRWWLERVRFSSVLDIQEGVKTADRLTETTNVDDRSLTLYLRLSFPGPPLGCSSSSHAAVTPRTRKRVVPTSRRQSHVSSVQRLQMGRAFSDSDPRDAISWFPSMSVKPTACLLTHMLTCTCCKPTSLSGPRRRDEYTTTYYLSHLSLDP